MPADPSLLDAALDSLAAAPVTVTSLHKTCGVARIMQEIPEATVERLRRLIDETDRTCSSIAKTLTDAGYPIKQYTINRHRKRKSGGGCSCP